MEKSRITTFALLAVIGTVISLAAWHENLALISGLSAGFALAFVSKMISIVYRPRVEDGI